MSISCPDECFKIDMGCDCPPPPPDKPLPFMFILFNTNTTQYPFTFVVHPSNPGKVGVSVVSASLPSYTSLTTGVTNYAHALPIVIAAPPAGPGAVQATAVMTVDAIGNATVTMTNVGAGYTTSTIPLTVSHTYSNYFNTIHVKPAAATTIQGVGAPIGRLTLPPPYGASLTIPTGKALPQISGYLTNTLAGGSPITVSGKWFKNGVQIGDTQQKVISLEGRHPWTHYCPATTFSNTDTLSYKLSSASATELVDFYGMVEYFVQYV